MIIFQKVLPLHGCGSLLFLVAFQASEQRQRACRRLQSVRRSVTLAEHWRENLPGAELTAPVTVCPIKAREAGLADRVTRKC